MRCPGQGPVEDTGHTETRLCRPRLLAHKRFGRSQNLGLAGFTPAKRMKMGPPGDLSPPGMCARTLRTMGAEDVVCAALARAR